MPRLLGAGAAAAIAVLLLLFAPSSEGKSYAVLSEASQISMAATTASESAELAPEWRVHARPGRGTARLDARPARL